MVSIEYLFTQKKYPHMRLGQALLLLYHQIQSSGTPVTVHNAPTPSRYPVCPNKTKREGESETERERARDKDRDRQI